MQQSDRNLLKTKRVLP